LGTIYCRLERFDKAVESLTKAISKDRSSSRAFLNLGFAHRRLARPAMALSAYREAIRLDPTLVDAHLGLAGTFLELRNPQQALVHYLKVLEIRPDHPAAEEGRRAALRALEQAEREAGPFGRLVNPDEYLGRRLDDRVRILSDEERRRDREALGEFCTAVRNVARHLAQHLRDRIRPRLVSVQSLVAVGREFSPEFREHHFELERDVRTAAELRHVLRERMVLLRAHDELMRRPVETDAPAPASPAAPGPVPPQGS
jgi:tetratricopeptide (TPR) repeat protein